VELIDFSWVKVREPQMVFCFERLSNKICRSSACFICHKRNRHLCVAIYNILNFRQSEQSTVISYSLKLQEEPGARSLNVTARDSKGFLREDMAADEHGSQVPRLLRIGPKVQSGLPVPSSVHRNRERG
jgi:hypothetical protein